MKEQVTRSNSDVPANMPESSLLAGKKFPNLYMEINKSISAARGFFDAKNNLSTEIFNEKEQIAIAIAVAQVNLCDYCIAMYSHQGLELGFSPAEVLSFRQGVVDHDIKMDAVVQLAVSITENEGKPDQIIVERFLEAGFDHGALIELIYLVSLNIFTNYVSGTLDIPLDYPQVKDFPEYH